MVRTFPTAPHGAAAPQPHPPGRHRRPGPPLRQGRGGQGHVAIGHSQAVGGIVSRASRRRAARPRTRRADPGRRRGPDRPVDNPTRTGRGTPTARQAAMAHTARSRQAPSPRPRTVSGREGRVRGGPPGSTPAPSRTPAPREIPWAWPPPAGPAGRPRPPPRSGLPATGPDRGRPGPPPRGQGARAAGNRPGPAGSRRDCGAGFPPRFRRRCPGHRSGRRTRPTARCCRADRVHRLRPAGSGRMSMVRESNRWAASPRGTRRRRWGSRKTGRP